jgi:hypothetical protein
MELSLMKRGLQLHVANSGRIPISNLLGGTLIVDVDFDPALGFSDANT